MQADFHYYVVRVIAEKAGFKPEEAQLIAYASQYVDDATDHKPLKIPFPKLVIDSPRFKDGLFDPICTAHKGLQMVEDFKISVQEKIYLSFHFIPPEPFFNQKNYSFIVKPNSLLVRKLMKFAQRFLLRDWNERNLIRLGIATHSFLDTWSHSEFSGRYSTQENDISEIKIFDGKHYKKINPFKQFFNNLLPSVGHAEAMEYPDLPFLKWSFTRDSQPNMEIVKNNPELFLEASEKLFNLFCDINKCDKKHWDSLKPRLWKCINFVSYELEERINFIKKSFPEIHFNYNPDEWKNEIFNPPQFTDKTITYEPKKYWFYFHCAAFEQRNYVLSLIKPLDKDE